MESNVGIRPALPFFLLFALFFVIAVRLFQVQVLDGTRLADSARRIVRREEPLPAPRGRILDREGRVLAFSRPVAGLIADPVEIRRRSDPRSVASWLSKPLGMTPAQVLERIGGSGRYRVVKKGLAAKEAEEVRALLRGRKVLGFSFEEECLRTYPLGPVAAHVVGFSGPRTVKDAEGRERNVYGGIAGIEGRYDPILRGKEGRRRYTALTNPFETGLYQPDSEVLPEPGADIRLTLDAVVATVAYEELASLAEKRKPQWAAAIVMDPRTGEVLALESFPTFDPNRYGRYPVESLLNRAVACAFTPGSSFKPFVMAGALEEGLVRMTETIDCEQGEWVYGRRRIHDHEREGILTPAQVMARSSNIGMAKIGLRLGCTRAEGYVRLFGFGRKTGIELPGEAFGQMTPRSAWSEAYTLCSVSYGHEISVTPVRLAASFCLFANEGDLLEPRLLDRVVYPDGRVVPVPPGRRKKVLGPETLAKVRGMLAEVMRTGTGKTAASRIVPVAGKTGTTVKDQLQGGKRTYTSTYVGFAPADAPRLLVLVVVDEPQGAYYGSQVAAPAAVRILERGLRVLGGHSDPKGIDFASGRKP